MPMYLCRWENGLVSVIFARDKEDAIERLDFWGNAEGLPLVRIDSAGFLLRLDDEAGLEMLNIDEDTDHEIYRHAYPLLEKLWGNVPMDERGEVTPEGQRMIRETVEKERQRVKAKPGPEPETQLGKQMKRDLDMATSLVNRRVKEGARRRLLEMKPDKKRKPN
jgi:hypothetical protein